MKKTLRLILGDQLNEKHSWFSQKEDHVTYVMMELRSETDYVKHHIQKLLGFFGSMRRFSKQMTDLGHQFIYIKISDSTNNHRFAENLQKIIAKRDIQLIQYLEPDEYRLDLELAKLQSTLNIPVEMHDSEHFLTKRKDVANFFGEKKYLMENFYRHMRKKHDVLLDDEEKPIGDAWNFDQENRKKLPKDIKIPNPHVYGHDLTDIHKEIIESKTEFFGEVDPQNFIWPLDRKEALETFDYFLDNLLDDFGPYQDALDKRFWSNFHSRISFAMNLKMISPLEVIKKTEEALKHADNKNLSSVEGFIRQILGWREYMRGVYWAKMPDYENQNFFEFKDDLPAWYWDGKTKMSCMQHSIGQSLKYAYAHHIQRLMITGNFALLLQTNPEAVDQWYLGVYIDAIQWVEITNTRGMSQYADGGLLSSKPYISSANYVNKMSNYCSGCHYDHKEKTTENACPFNALYWHFLETQSDKLRKNPRMSMPFRILDKMKDSDRQALSEKALSILENKDSL